MNENFKSGFVGGVFHFNLEGVALETNLVELDGFEYSSLVAFEAGGSVVHLEPCYEPYIFRSEIAHQHSADRPVHHVHSAYVA